MAQKYVSNPGSPERRGLDVVALPGQDRHVLSHERLRSSIIELLGTGAMDRDVLAQELLDSGHVASPTTSLLEQIDRLLRSDSSFSEVTSGTIYLPAVVEGTTWTVWIDPDNAAAGFVRVEPHLSPLAWWLISGDVDLVDESGVVLGPLLIDGILLDDSDTDVVYGPEGWLTDLGSGWASVAVTNGALHWSRCENPPGPNALQAAAVRAGFDRDVTAESAILFGGEIADLRFTSVRGPILEALTADRQAFTEQVAPLPDVYRAAGLEGRGAIIAAAGFDWEALRSWRERSMVRIAYGLDPAEIDGLMVVVGACQTYTEQGPSGLGGDEDERRGAAVLLGTVLDDGDIAAAVWEECERRGVSVGAIGEFADELAGHLGGAQFVGLTWLRTRCLDRLGDGPAAARMLGEAVTGTCAHTPALIEAAGFAADRGDAAAAYRLLRRTGAVDRLADESDDGADLDNAALLVAEVQGFALHRPAPTAGRNDPCPCGSGRKYKACHLGREQHSLDDRSAWLSDKAKRYVRNCHPDAASSLAETMADHADSDDLYDQLADSPFTVDLALHEGGLFAEFLAARHAMIPADEALLATQWALVDRGVFEIRGVVGDRVDLHDIGRGDEITVVNTYPTNRTRVGTVMVGRPVPVGDTYRAFSGFIEIPRAAVSDVLAAIDSGDLDVILDCFGRIFRRPLQIH